MSPTETIAGTDIRRSPRDPTFVLSSSLTPRNADRSFFFPCRGEKRWEKRGEEKLDGVTQTSECNDSKQVNVKSLNAKTDVSIFINLRYLRLKLLKNKENDKKICDIFHHSFKYIPCYVMSEKSMKRFYFALFDDGLTLKTLKLVYIGFCIQTHNFLFYSTLSYHWFLQPTLRKWLWYFIMRFHSTSR